MLNTENQLVPGLRIWIAVLAALGCIIVFVWQLPSRDSVENSEIRSWLMERSASAGEKKSVLILGTSLTGCGIDSAKRLENTVQESSGENVQVLKIWKLNAGPETFADLAPALKSFHPVSVGIEANMLFYSFVKDKGWPAYVQRLRDVITRNHHSYEPDAKPVILKRQMMELEGFRTGMMDTTRLTGFASLLQYWNAHGTTIFLLNFPLQGELEIKKWRSVDTVYFSRNLAYLKRYCRIDYFSQEKPMDERYFIDHAHMNLRGQKKQSDLFCAIITRQIQRP